MSRASRKECQRIEAELVHTAAGRVSMTAAVQEHLERCEGCRRRMTELGEGMSEARAQGRVPLSPAMRERVREALRPTLVTEAARARQRTAKWWRVGWGQPWRWVLAGATAAAATAVVWTLVPLFPGEDVGTAVVSTRMAAKLGDVNVRLNQLLNEGDAVELDADSRALVVLDHARVAGVGRTALVLAKLASQETIVDLRRGTVVVDVQRGKEPYAFVVRAAWAQVHVTGTRFMVRDNEAGGVVAVERGHVEVRTSMGGRHQVSAGEVLSVNANGDVQTSMLADPERAAMEVALTPERWEYLQREEQPPVERLTPLVDQVPPRRVRSAPPAGRQGASLLDRVSAEVAAGACAAAEAIARTASRGTEAAIVAEALVLVADCFYGARDEARSVGIYREVARRFAGSPAAENAAYEVARIAYGAGRRAEAEQAFGSYLRRYPRGALMGEARFRLCGLQADRGAAADAVRCLRAYRKASPQGKYVAEAFLLEATLLRTTMKDCRGAIAAYDAYTARGGEYGAQAMQWRQWCEQQLESKTP